MATVWIRHPVTNGEAQVAESALPHWVGAGWQRFDPPPPPAPEPPAEPDDPADPKTTAPRRRRSTSPEGS